MYSNMLLRTKRNLSLICASKNSLEQMDKEYLLIWIVDRTGNNFFSCK